MLGICRKLMMRKILQNQQIYLISQYRPYNINSSYCMKNYSSLNMIVNFKMAKQTKKQKDKAKQQTEKKKIKQQIGNTAQFDLNVYEEEYERILQSYQNTLSTYKLGRLDQTFFVNFYARVGNKNQPINQLAEIAPKSANICVLNPYDNDSLDPIEKSLQASDFGFQISRVEKTLVVTQPPNSMNEVKKKFIEKLKKETQNKKEKMNNVRQKARDQLKKYKKIVMQERIKQIQVELKNLSEKYYGKLEKIASNKEKELSK